MQPPEAANLPAGGTQSPPLTARARAKVPWRAALADMADGLRHWRIWQLLAWLDIKQ